MTVRPAPLPCKQRNPIPTVRVQPSAGCAVNLYSQANHSPWLHISLFLQALPSKKSTTVGGAI